MKMRIKIESRDAIEKINKAQVIKKKNSKKVKDSPKNYKQFLIQGFPLLLSLPTTHARTHAHTHTHPKNLPVIRTYTQRGQGRAMIKERSGSSRAMCAVCLAHFSSVFSNLGGI